MSHSTLFKVVATSERNDATELMLIAQEGRVWRARRSGMRTAIQPGDVLTVPVIERRADFSLLDFESARPVGQARPDVVARLCGVHPVVPERTEEQRRALRALIDTPGDPTLDALVKLLM
jgi:hypothetical protein